MIVPQKARVPVIFCALAALFLVNEWRVTLRGQLGEDLFLQSYPGKVFCWREIHQNGELPLWNPHIFTGIPFLADSQMSNVFYPPNWIFFVSCSPWTFAVSHWFHLSLAGLGAFFCARQLTETSRDEAPFGAVLGGLTYMFCGGMIARISHLNLIQAAAWLPVAVLLFDRALRRKHLPWTLLLGVVLCLQFLVGGDPVILISTVLCLALQGICYVLQRNGQERRKAAGRGILVLTAAGLLALLLSACQLLPTLELLTQTARYHRGTGSVARASFPPWNLITFLLPNALGSPLSFTSIQGRLFTETAVYVGIVPLLLLLFAFGKRNPDAPSVRLFLLIFLLGLFLALGSFNPIYRWLLVHIPPFSRLPIPARFSILCPFALSMLAASGFHRWQTTLNTQPEQERSTRRLLHVLLIGIAASGVLLLLLAREPVEALMSKLVSLRYEAPELYLQKVPGLFRGEAAGLCALLGISAIAFPLLWPQTSLQLNPRGRTYALLLLAVSDLCLFGLRFPGDRARSTEAVAVPSDLMDEKFSRVLPMDHKVISPNDGMRFGFDSILGYDPVTPARYLQFLEAIHGAEITSFRAPLVAKDESPLLDLLGVKYVLRKVDGGSQAFLMSEHPQPLPRAFCVQDAKGAKDGAEALELMTAPNFDPRVMAIVEGSTQTSTSLEPSTAVVDIVEYRPNRVTLRAELSEPQLLVLTDADYSGWRVQVDGRRAQLLRTNAIMRGVWLEAGEHAVIFRFVPRSLLMGGLLTTATLLCVLAIGWTRRGGRIGR